METTPQPPKPVMASFAVSQPVFVTATDHADIWRVTRSDGSEAALKLYRDRGFGNEAFGFDYLRALQGSGAARAYARSGRAVLVEWLPGPSLGDLARDGQDRAAAQALADVACRLQSTPPFPCDTWPRLNDWFDALFQLRTGSDCPDEFRRALDQSKTLARDVLSHQTAQRPLHGDLHHDNVRETSRGYCAFDAKGLVGDPAYELANAFRHPRGAPARLRDPARLRYLRDLWSAALDLSPQRLMAWAAVKTALSIAWRSGGCAGTDPDSDLLQIMLAVHADR